MVVDSPWSAATNHKASRLSASQLSCCPPGCQTRSAFWEKGQNFLAAGMICNTLDVCAAAGGGQLMLLLLDNLHHYCSLTKSDARKSLSPHIMKHQLGFLQ